MKRSLPVVLFTLLIFCACIAQAQSTIPFVQSSKEAATRLKLGEINSIHCTNVQLEEEAQTFNIFLKNAGKPILVQDSKVDHSIKLIFDPLLNEEEYKIKVSGNSLEVSGRKSGVFYGLMTIFQWMTQDEAPTVLIENHIHDYPEFRWRGMHLDVCRHFFPTGFIKKYIDILALHKMNTFHWHLTDDQGWRIEIKKYPLLTKNGSKRKETIVDKNFDPYVGDKIPVEGFYTQDQIADVIKYASLRHITIVPEIEMPGHAQAALSAYPEYSCDKQPIEVMTYWGVSQKVFCTEDKTIEFLKNILDEVMALFPSQYIHIGGDEVPKESWKKCPNCQQNIKKNRLRDEHELQSYFIKQIDEYVNSKGRSIIGWDEILEGGLAENAAVMSWRGETGGIAAAKEKHAVVMSPGSHCYFDHYQTNPEGEPLAIGGFTPIEKVYAYNPIPKQLNDKERKYILGAQGNVWTEYMQVSSQVEYMAVPRICALAEVLWTGEKKPGFDNFKTRLRTHFAVLKQSQIYYSNAIFDVMPESKIKGDTAEISLKSHFLNGNIYYTLNGTEPNTGSPIYKPSSIIKLTTNDQLKARYFENDKPLGKTLRMGFPKK